jgi:predicted RNase H-like HicB family nuclease
MATYGTSRKSSEKRSAARRRFAADVLRQARHVVDRYAFVVRLESDEDGHAARPVELPSVVGFGETAEEAVREAKALALTTVAYLLEQGQPVPPPGAESMRTEQVNFRVSVEEKIRMEAAAQRQGMSLVEFVRSSALAVDPLPGRTSSRA